MRQRSQMLAQEVEERRDHLRRGGIKAIQGIAPHTVCVASIVELGELSECYYGLKSLSKGPGKYQEPRSLRLLVLEKCPVRGPGVKRICTIVGRICDLGVHFW